MVPSYSVDVGPTVPSPTHHVSLVAEDGTEIGLILCDASGKRLPTAIARANLQTVPVKTSSGDSQYSDGELPFVVSAQQDWSGGMGNERFEDNQTQYQAGARVQNVKGKMCLGPREHFATGYQPMVVSQPRPHTSNYDEGQIGRIKWTQSSNPNKIATKFTTVDAITAGNFFMFGKTIGSGANSAHVVHWEISADDAGGSEPGMLVGSGSFTPLTHPDGLMRWEWPGINFPNLAAATSYWMALYPDAGADASNHFEMGFWLNPAANPARGVASSVISSDLGANWDAYPNSSFQLMFRIEEDELEADGWFFDYRHQKYWISRPATGPPQLFMNGWRGVCDVGASALKLYDSTQTGTGWANDGAEGCTVLIFAGPGSQNERPFRKITGSRDGELDVGGWIEEPTEESEYVILGSGQWFPITHTMPHPPTGRPAVGVGGDPPDNKQAILYIPQGHDQSSSDYQIWMYREYNNAGVFTRESKGINDGTGGAGDFRSKLIISVQDATKGPILVKVEDNNAKGTAGIVAEARTPGTWTEQLGWGGDERLGDELPSMLVNAIEYVDPNTEKRVAWAFTWDEMYAREGGEIPALWSSVLLPELKEFASEWTGRSLAVWNTSLFLTLTGGLLERLTGGNMLTDVGPLKGTASSGARRSEITALAAYPGQLFVAMAPRGDVGFSVITRMRGLDNHDPIYEGGRNRLIKDMSVQNIPAGEHGSIPPTNRLWFQERYNFMWIDLPSQGQTPLNDPSYQFAAEGYVESSRIYVNLDDRQKVFSSLKVVSDNLLGGGGYGKPEGTRWIAAEYEVDTDSAYEGMTAVSNGILTTSPSEEIYLTDYSSDQVAALRGRYLRTRLRLNTVNENVSPVVRGHLIESLLGLPNKFSFKATVLFEDGQLDLRNDPYTDDQAWEQAGRLQEYAEQTEIFTLKAPSSTLNGAKVIISPPEVAPLGISKDAVTTEGQVAEERLIGTLSIIQVILPDLGLIP